MDAKWYWDTNPGHFDLLEENAFEMMGSAPELLLSQPSFNRPSESGAPPNENDLPAALKSVRIRTTKRVVNPIKQNELDFSGLSSLPFVSGSRNIWLSWTKGFFHPADESKRDSIEKVRSFGTDRIIWQNLPVNGITPTWPAPTEQSSAGSAVAVASFDSDHVQFAGLFRLSSSLRAATSISGRTSRLSWPHADFRLDADSPATSGNLYISTSSNSMLASFMRQISTTLAVGSQLGFKDSSLRACVGARLRSSTPQSNTNVSMKEATVRLDSDGLVRGSAVSQISFPSSRSSLKIGAVAEVQITDSGASSEAPRATTEGAPKLICSAELKGSVHTRSTGKLPFFVKTSACNQSGLSITAASRLFNRLGVAVHLIHPSPIGFFQARPEPSSSSNTLPSASPTIKFSLEL